MKITTQQKSKIHFTENNIKNYEQEPLSMDGWQANIPEPPKDGQHYDIDLTLSDVEYNAQYESYILKNVKSWGYVYYPKRIVRFYRKFKKLI